MAKQKVTLSLEPVAYEQLQARAERVGMSVSGFVTMMAWFGQMVQEKQEHKDDVMSSVRELLMDTKSAEIEDFPTYRGRLTGVLQMLQENFLPDCDLEHDVLQGVIDRIKELDE